MLIYLAHPVGHDPAERASNLENTKLWLSFLVANTDWAICCPWFVYVSTFDESFRKRAMRDDLMNLSKCDGIVLTGGRISPGMKTELGLAQMGMMQVFDLTPAGYSPSPEALTLLRSLK